MRILSQNRINLISPFNDHIESIQVIDALGRVIFNGKLSAENSLNIESFAAGQYLMRIHAKGTRKVLPFIKK